MEIAQEDFELLKKITFIPFAARNVARNVDLLHPGAINCKSMFITRSSVTNLMVWGLEFLIEDILYDSTPICLTSNNLYVLFQNNQRFIKISSEDIKFSVISLM